MTFVRKVVILGFSSWLTQRTTLTHTGHGGDSYSLFKRLHLCSLARSAGRSGPEDFVGLTGLTAPALLGWGLRVIVCAWSVSVWVGPR